MKQRALIGTLKRGVVLFWAAWFTIVCLTNLLDALRACGFLASTWPMASGNFSLLQKTTSVYHLSAPVNAFLFVCVISWEGLSAVFFWRAFIRFDDRLVVRAFLCGMALFAAFTLACEVFLSYQIEGVHVSIFTALLASLIAVKLLPEDKMSA